MAEWQSGDAADCNSVNAGSIPTSASKFNVLVYYKAYYVTTYAFRVGDKSPPMPGW